MNVHDIGRHSFGLHDMVWQTKHMGQSLGLTGLLLSDRMCIPVTW